MVNVIVDLFLLDGFSDLSGCSSLVFSTRKFCFFKSIVTFVQIQRLLEQSAFLKQNEGNFSQRADAKILFTFEKF